MAQITTTIPFVDMPVAADGEAAFITKANALPPQFTALTNDSQSFATQANALRDEVNGFQQTATAQAVAAANSATLSERWATDTGALVNGIDYSAKEYAIGTTVESSKRHASGTVATGSAKDWASSTTEVADGLKGARGYAQDSQTALSDVQSVIALAETVPFTLTSGDDFDSLSKVWPLIRTAFETNSLPWKPIVNLDFARDNYEAYVGLSVGTTRAPLLDLAAFSRASSGTGINAFGNVETVSANQPRIIFENGVAKGVLLEDTATNLLTWSEDFTNAAWSRIGVSLLGSTDSILETGNSSEIIESTDNGGHYINQNYGGFVAGSVYTMQLLVKAGDRSSLQIIFTSNAFGGNVVRAFDLLNVTASSGGTIKHVSDGWYLCSATATATTTAGTGVQIRLSNTYTTNIAAYTGDGVSSIYLAYAQLEQSSIPSSYIKTEGTSVLRAADGLSKTLPAQFNANGNWAIRGEFTTKSNVFDTSVAFTTITDDTTSNEVTLRPDASGFMSLLVNANSVAISTSSSVLLDYDTVYKFMIVKEGNNYHLYLNGLLAATAVNTEAFDATVVKFGQGRLDSTKANLIYSDHQIYTAFDYDADFDVLSKVVTGV